MAGDEPQDDRWLLILDDPVLGILPWLAWGLLPYITSALVSACVAAGLSLSMLGLTWWRGERPKVLESSDGVLFSALVVVGLFGSVQLNGWFEDHADLVSNLALTVLAIGSLVVGRPFTAPYTDARFPGMPNELTETLDVVSTGTWGLGLVVATLVTWYGEYVLDNPGDFWTGWIFQLLPLVLAYHATLWFDRRAVWVFAGRADPEPSGWELVRNVMLWLTPLGVLVVFTHPAPVWLGETLMVAGVSGFVLGNAMLRRRHAVSRAPGVRTAP